MHLGVKPIPFEIIPIGIEPERRVVIESGSFVIAQTEGGAAMRLTGGGKIWPQSERALISRESFRAPSHPDEHVAAVVMALVVCRVQRGRAVEIRQRTVE